MLTSAYVLLEGFNLRLHKFKFSIFGTCTLRLGKRTRILITYLQFKVFAVLYPTICYGFNSSTHAIITTILRRLLYFVLSIYGFLFGSKKSGTNSPNKK
jgi:hypothetical protein